MGFGLSLQEPSAEENGKTPLTVAQKKAQNIMESFENPFRMFLPSLEHRAHISQAAKFDPSSKIYEISNRWKLASQVQKEPKEETTKKVAEQTGSVPVRVNMGSCVGVLCVLGGGGERGRSKMKF
ncbi:exosome component 10-like [Alexandromys fortis]|uniref:exosome component 10-like n=1 Tax=Alexandromys fortis TaxID=100897 RepID=UPI00215363DD|nr:exosome component 10-like [Microtus fortis]